MAKVAFLGLGVMGYPMAGHLRKKGGHDVTVYNRTAAKAEQWVKEYGGRSAATPKEAAGGCDFVMMCVGNDDDVRSVAYGDSGALAGLEKGSIL
ncbi:MAG: NAD(P)-dependent oxidoreductase, partial [Burkholderiales bacterium]|nr:NAD(P)-dependent oxidoreductase [Burkholderiales bacterium]